MEKIFESKLFPIFTALLSICIGIVSSLLGATPVTSILIAILVELWITTHHIISKIRGLETILGYSKGISQMSTVIPKVHNILEYEDKFCNLILLSKLDKLNFEIDQLHKKKISLNPDEFMDFAEKLFTTIGKNDIINATSLFGGGDYWKKKYGTKYANLNFKAAHNGVSITRVFIPKDENDQNKLDQIYKNQASYLNVRVVYYDELSEVDMYAIKDFFVLNNELVVEFIFDATFNHISSIVIMFSVEEINIYRRKMNKIMEISSAYSPV